MFTSAAQDSQHPVWLSDSIEQVGDTEIICLIKYPIIFNIILTPNKNKTFWPTCEDVQYVSIRAIVLKVNKYLCAIFFFFLECVYVFFSRYLWMKICICTACPYRDRENNHFSERIIWDYVLPDQLKANTEVLFLNPDGAWISQTLSEGETIFFTCIYQFALYIATDWAQQLLLDKSRFSPFTHKPLMQLIEKGLKNNGAFHQAAILIFMLNCLVHFSVMCTGQRTLIG